MELHVFPLTCTCTAIPYSCTCKYNVHIHVSSSKYFTCYQVYSLYVQNNYVESLAILLHVL